MDLETHIGDRRPAYATLSHTWGDEEEEVSLQEYQSKPKSELEGRSGYRKIEATCKQAKRWGIPYAWVDTCCIDKTSSAELSEAINSMFNWYRDSSVCFAYLSDVVYNVEASGQMTGNPPKTSSLSSQLRASKWFTRGWTLQELIAPKQVVFFDVSWNEISDRHDMANLLASITSIHHALLQNWNRTPRRQWSRPLVAGEGYQPLYKLSQFSVAQRISWASDRVTTRLEDEAYCLLGILEVNMPLLYGEGVGAFRRLQEEIIRTSSDQSIFAWDEGGWTNGKLLASHPSAFRGCGRLINLPESSSHTSYEIKNDGLHIRLPILATPYGSCCSAFGVLNCRNRDDYRGQVALSLHKLRVLDNSLLQFPEIQDNNLHIFSDARDGSVYTPGHPDVNFTNNYVLQRSNHQRLSVIASKHIANCPIRSIVITSAQIGDNSMPTSRFNKDQDFVVIQGGKNNHGCQIRLCGIFAGPQSNMLSGYVRLWNVGHSSDRSYYRGYDSDYDGVCGCLFDLGKDDDRPCFMIVLRARPHNRFWGVSFQQDIVSAGLASVEDFKNIRTTEELLSFDKLDKWGTTIEKGDEHETLLFHRSSVGSFDAVLTRKLIMGEKVAVLEIPGSSTLDSTDSGEPVALSLV